MNIADMIGVAEERLSHETTTIIEWNGRGNFERLNTQIGMLRNEIAALGADFEEADITLVTPVIEGDRTNLDPFSRHRKFDPAKNADYLNAQKANIALLKAKMAAVAEPE